MTKPFKYLALFVILGFLFFIAFQNRYLLQSFKNALPSETPNDNLINKLIKSTKRAEGDLAKLTLPPGFSIAYFAKNVPGARSLSMTEDGGIIFVGTRDKTVYAITDPDHNGLSNEIIVISEELDTPNGVAYKDGDLYVAEVSKILKFENILETYADKPGSKIIFDGLPSDSHHGWKYIAFGPDDQLYIPVGAPCNNCEDTGRYARINSLDLSTNTLEVVATGVRNTVGFDWNPVDDTLWFTDNGRDGLGDDTPKDELNKVTQAPQFYGFPYCHGYNTPDPKLTGQQSCLTQTKPILELGPHVAALGIKFYTGSMFPQEYKHKAIIAEHGSWNRTTPIGYRLTTVDISGESASSYTPFVDGWLQGDDAWGRPVDILILPDGSVLISDDKAGAIYRLTYN